MIYNPSDDDRTMPEEPTQSAQLSELTPQRIAGLQLVTAALAQSLTASQVAEVVVNHGVGVLGARAGALILLTSIGDLEVLKTSGYSQETVEPFRRMALDAHLPLSDAVLTNEPVYLTSLEESQLRYPQLSAVMTNSDQGGAWAALPLLIDRRAIGALGLTFERGYAFSNADKAFMLALAQQCAQALERARLYEESQTARLTAVAAERKMAFLAEATAVLSGSLDYESTLTAMAQFVVPELADWCAIDMLDEDGSVKRLAVAHIDPEKIQWAHEVHRRYPPDTQATNGLMGVLRTGRSECYYTITDEMVVAGARDAAHLEILREIGLSSVMIVPLTARGRILGVISFVNTIESGRKFGPSDLVFAEDLANRAAIAVDNARLYRDSQASEKSKAETLAQFEGVLAGIPSGFAFIDRDFRFVHVNEPLARINGVPLEAHIGQFVWDIIGVRVWELRKPFFERALTGEAIIDVDLSANLPLYSTEARSMMASYFPVRVDGEVIGVGAVINDITERVRSEQAIRESEERFRLVADTAPVMIWMSGLDALCFYFNRPWLSFTGRTMEQEIGNGWTEGINPEDFDHCITTYRTAFEARAPFEIEYRLRRYDGEYRWLMDIGSPRFQADGSFVGFIGSCIDVTERKRVEQAVQENEVKQRALLRDVLASVTEGKLVLCETPDEMPLCPTLIGQPIELTIHTMGDLRHLARNAAIDLRFSVDRTQDFETAVGEAVMNAVVHAGGGIGMVCVGPTGSLLVSVEDHGKGIDMSRLPRATLERGFTTAGSLGHGFWMMLQTVDRIWLMTGATGTTIIVEQERIAPEPTWLLREYKTFVSDV